ncbi:hypothetical protein HMPREF1051_2295 [Neisseria sicca VK64]|uniref:Uncharacterized protein n=1 Tax=Neisseria sicca VK64 TaxID=1095748 RepID=I2NKW4_NEISI|nr:hypothetical protein HMPREF1051_2295 [Neisseria sicca VK64]
MGFYFIQTTFSDDLISTLPLTQIKRRQILPLPMRPVRG